MLPKEHRLHKDTEIKRLVRTGKTFFLPQFIIKYSPNKEDITKVGFIVSAKVDKRAVVRNRLTRQMREILRALLPDFEKGFSVLIIAKKQALELDFEAIEKQFIFAFSKIKIYNKNK